MSSALWATRRRSVSYTHLDVYKRQGHISVPEKPEKKAVPLKAADLDNPYGRVFGTPRSREDLRKQDR